MADRDLDRTPTLTEHWVAAVITQHFAELLDPGEFFADRDIESAAIVKAGLVNAGTANMHSVMAATFVQGVQIGVLIAEEAARREGAARAEA